MAKVTSHQCGLVILSRMTSAVGTSELHRYAMHTVLCISLLTAVVCTAKHRYANRPCLVC
jgi:hypothetical protein